MTRNLLTGANLSGPLELNGSAGTSGQVLQSAGAGAIPTWAAAPAAGAGGSTGQVQFNNAGTLGNVPKQSIGSLDQAEFLYVINANTYGALKMAEAFKPNLAASTQKKVFGMSSGLGSSAMVTRRGGFYAYRASKAALNIVFRSLAADWRDQGIIVGIIAPGMVETDLLRASGFQGRSITPTESVAGMIKVIDGMTLDNNGAAINYDGKVIPW